MAFELEFYHKTFNCWKCHRLPPAALVHFIFARCWEINTLLPHRALSNLLLEILLSLFESVLFTRWMFRLVYIFCFKNNVVTLLLCIRCTLWHYRTTVLLPLRLNIHQRLEYTQKLKFSSPLVSFTLSFIEDTKGHTWHNLCNVSAEDMGLMGQCSLNHRWLKINVTLSCRNVTLSCWAVGPGPKWVLDMVVKRTHGAFRVFESPVSIQPFVVTKFCINCDLIIYITKQ